MVTTDEITTSLSTAKNMLKMLKMPSIKADTIIAYTIQHQLQKTRETH
jgi:hypothetical protein